MPAYYYSTYPFARRIYLTLNAAKAALKATTKHNYYVLNIRSYKPNKLKARYIIFECSKSSKALVHADTAFTYLDR